MSKVAKATFYLMVVTIIAKILGMGRELVLSAVYGAGLYTESYLTAMNIPNIIFVAIGTSIVTTFIPMYQNVMSKQGEEQALKFLNNVFNIVVIICIFVAILGTIFSGQLVKLFAIGFKGERFLLTVRFTEILIIGIVFIGMSSIISAFLQIEGRFIAVGFGSVPYNLIIIISIIASSKMNIYALPIGAVLAMVVQLLFYVFFLKDTNYRYIPYLNLKDENMIKLLKLLAPVLIGVMASQISSLIDTTLASTLSKGSIPALTYASRLNGFVTGTFTASIVSVVYPMLSKLSSQENKTKFIASVTSSVNMIIVSMIPISVGSMVLAKPIVSALFERGAFNARATDMTAVALVFYSIGMTSFGLRDILGKVFYSLQDTKTPMMNGVISVAMNIFLNLVLIRYMGHGGLALATSMSSIICIILLFNNLKKKVGYFGQDKIISTMIKSLIGSTIMGFIAYFTYKTTSQISALTKIGDELPLLISILAGFLSYVIMIVAFKVDEVEMILDIAKNKLRLKRN